MVATAGVVCGCPFTTRQAEFFAVKMTYHPTKRNFVWKFRLDSDVWTEWTWCVSPGRKSSVMETFTTWDDAVRYATVGWLGPYGPVTGAPDVTEEM